MPKHLHTFGVLIGRAKTRKTLCGKRVPESHMATGTEQTDCLACREARDNEIVGYRLILESAERGGTATPELRQAVLSFLKAPYGNAEVLR